MGLRQNRADINCSSIFAAIVVLETESFAVFLDVFLFYQQVRLRFFSILPFFHSFVFLFLLFKNN